ncbi:tetratricopeptide repeat protein [Aquimarina rubra]|uniref:Tetratricopeptide repeat protein n=1 Tax=Aquimarina rubra TaxID=1920033 RepID=A0ABW5LIX7_9FLAO
MVSYLQRIWILFLFLLVGIVTFSFTQYALKDALEYIEKGKTLYNSGEYIKSLDFFDKARTISVALENDSLIGIIDIRKGHSFLLSGKNEEAVEAYYSALAITEKTGDLDQQVRAKSGLILVLKGMNQLDKAYAIASEILRTIDKTSYSNTKTHVNILTTICDIYLALEYYQEVLSFAEKGIDISKSIDYKEGLIDFYIKKGMIFYYQKKYEDSFKYLLDAKNILEQNEITNSFFPFININYFLASCYYEQGNYDKAINQLEKTTKSLKEEDLIKPLVVQSYLLLANCYGEKKDFEKALYYNNEYLRIHKDFQENRDEIVNTIYKKEAEKLEQKINIITEKNETSELKKQVVIMVLVLLLVILMVIVFNYRRKQINNKKVFDDLMIKVNQLESKKVTKADSQKVIPKDLGIDEKKINEILKRLAKLESEEYFLRLDCNQRDIAKKLKTNHTYLSKIVRTYKEKSFTDYINDLRIEYAVKRLKQDKKFRSFSITSIANEIGYKSDYSFAKHFKAKTGLNPSYYIKNIEKQEKIEKNTA